jgi:nucleoside-diphosphate-sugar epimerase
MKRVLVTGASGLLGSAVVRLLTQSGFEVAATYFRRSKNLPGAVESIELDLAGDTGWNNLPRNIDAVVHAAALIPERVDDLSLSDRLWQINALGAQRLAFWAKENGVRRFVQCSTYSVYARPMPFPANENHSTYPVGPAAPYAVSKLAGEILVSSLNSPTFQTCNLRFSSIYGAAMMPGGVLYRFLAAAHSGEQPQFKAHLNSQFDFVYVQDAATAIHLVLMASPQYLHYNVGAGQGVTLPQLAEAIWAAFAPERKLTLPIQMEDIELNHAVVDIARAKQDLGYQPAFDIRSGLIEMSQHLNLSNRNHS